MIPPKKSPPPAPGPLGMFFSLYFKTKKCLELPKNQLSSIYKTIRLFVLFNVFLGQLLFEKLMVVFHLQKNDFFFRFQKKNQVIFHLKRTEVVFHLPKKMRSSSILSIPAVSLSSIQGCLHFKPLYTFYWSIKLEIKLSTGGSAGYVVVVAQDMWWWQRRICGGGSAGYVVVQLDNNATSWPHLAS